MYLLLHWFVSEVLREHSQKPVGDGGDKKAGGPLAIKKRGRQKIFMSLRGVIKILKQKCEIYSKCYIIRRRLKDMWGWGWGVSNFRVI